MEYISSDTNVWIDFNIISRMNLPFLLPYTYIMYTESMESELLNPEGFKDQLAEAGLVGVDITIEEFFLAQSWGPLYPKLSIQDRIALAIAKQRDITLLTGDKALRMAAAQEGVHVIGTLGILDQLFDGQYIAKDEYLYCLQEFQKHNGGEVRLPRAELKKRYEISRKNTGTGLKSRDFSDKQVQNRGRNCSPVKMGLQFLFLFFYPHQAYGGRIGQGF